MSGWNATNGRLLAHYAARGYAGRMSVARAVIERFGLTERTDDYTDRPHADLWSGSGVSPTISTPGEGHTRVERVIAQTGERPVEVEEWCDWPYRVVWRVREERVHITYCEGDVSVLCARSDEDFEAIERSAADFYARYR